MQPLDENKDLAGTSKIPPKNNLKDVDEGRTRIRDLLDERLDPKNTIPEQPTISTGRLASGYRLRMAATADTSMVEIDELDEDEIADDTEGNGDEPDDDAEEKDAIIEALEKGEIPLPIAESWRLVEPSSAEGKEFQDMIQTFVATLYKEDPSKAHLPHYEFKHHDFEKEPVRFMLSKQKEPNAWFMRHSKPPIIVLTEGLFREYKSKEKEGKVFRPFVTSPHDLAAILCHEMTHMKMRKVYGNIPNSKIEEGFAYALPLAIMYEHGRELGLNPERVMDEDGTSGIYNVMNSQLKAYDSWSKYMDVHPTHDNIRSVVSDTLAYLRKENGELAPEENELPDYNNSDRIMTVVNNAQHQSYLANRLSEVENYEAATVSEKLDTLGRILSALDRRYSTRITDIGDEIKSLRESVETSKDMGAIHRLADTLLTISDDDEHEDAKRRFSHLDYLYGELRSLTRSSKPLGRLRKVGTAIAKFVETVDGINEEEIDKEAVLQAADKLVQVVESENLHGTLKGVNFLRGIKWNQFSFPNVDAIVESKDLRREEIDQEEEEEEEVKSFYDTDYGQGIYGDESDDFDDDEDRFSWESSTDDSDGDDEENEYIPELPPWHALRRLSAQHPQVAKAAVFAGLKRDPFVFEALCNHGDVVYDYILDRAGQQMTAQKESMAALFDMSEEAFNSEAAINIIPSISNGPSGEGDTLEQLRYNEEGEVIGTSLGRGALDLSEESRAMELHLTTRAVAYFLDSDNPNSLQKLKGLTEIWHPFEHRPPICMEHCDHNIALFTELNSGPLTTEERRIRTFMDWLRKLKDEDLERYQNTVRQLFDSEEGKKLIANSMPGEMAFVSMTEERLESYHEDAVDTDQFAVSRNPYITFILQEDTGVFSPEEKYELFEELLTGDSITYIKGQEERSHFDGRFPIFDSELAALYIKKLDSVLTDVNKSYELQPRTWKKYLSILAESKESEEEVGLRTSVLMAEAVVLMIERTPSLKEAAQLVEVMGANYISGSVFQENLREALTKSATAFLGSISRTNNLTGTVRQWKLLSEADLIFPEMVDKVLTKILARIKHKNGNGGMPQDEQIRLCETILGGRRVQNPGLRTELIELWSTNVLAANGIDDGSSKYEQEAVAISERIQANVNRVDQKHILGQLAKDVEAQHRVSSVMRDKVYEVTKEMIDKPAYYGILTDGCIDAIRKSPEHRQSTLDFLTTPYSLNSAKHFIDSTIDALEFVDPNDPIRGAFALKSESDEQQVDTALSAFRYQLAMQSTRHFYENFWSAPIEIRAILSRELLISPEDSLGAVDAETFDYAISKLFPGGGLYEQESRYFIRAYVDALPHYQKHLCLAAMMSASEKKDVTTMRLGESLALFLENMGPAETKFGQAAQSHPLVPEDIRTDLKRLKYNADEPERWEVTEWIEEIKEDLERQCSQHFGKPTTITHIGDVVGSGSINVVTRVQLSNGGSYMLSIVRPNSLERGRAGFDTMSRMADNLGTAMGETTLQTTRELVQHASSRLDIETDCSIAKLQYGTAADIYRKSTVTMDERQYTFDAPDVIAAGDNFFLMTEMEGDHFIELEDESDEKREYAMINLTLEINNKLRGKFDSDRHGGNLKVKRDSLCSGHFDFKSMAMDEWSEEGYQQFASLLLSTLNGEKTVKQFFNDLVEQERLMRDRLQAEGKQLDPFVTEVQKGLLTDGEYTQFIGRDDLMRVIVSALLGGMNPKMQAAIMNEVSAKVPEAFRAAFETSVKPAVHKALETGELSSALQGFLPIQLSPEEVIKIEKTEE
ncbi:MAG: M48 family metalloprotease [Candidatus Peribacteraceae bacterium]|nr:M48 family metalloprotease [Candidatus Peribacteraceae bacterium]